METLAREVKSVPKSVDPSSSSSTDASKSMCVICLSEIKKEEGKAIFTGECSHSFHFGCITKNVEEGNRICPICRFQWTQIPTCDVRMMKKMEELEKKEHEREKNMTELKKNMTELKKNEHEREKNMTELKKNMAELKKGKGGLEKKMSELEKIKHEMMNELEKRNKIIHELKKENHELKKKIQDQEVEAGEENIGHKDSDQRVEAEPKMEVAREPENRSKKMKLYNDKAEDKGT